ncbi:MAG: Exopolyphosphatase [Phylliscum demangeonii]|nr:MAG: Exopolyphosphatase [Phylliscum demangeonii]
MKLPGLCSFLQSARQTLQHALQHQHPPPHRRLNFVIGNESGDLDSIASALVFAYMRTATSTAAAAAAAAAASGSDSHARTGPTDVYIPIANIAAADIPLRPELLALLAHIALAPADLITRDELRLGRARGEPTKEGGGRGEGGRGPALLKAEHTRWFLVDHHVLTGAVGEVYGARVAGVVDHHVDDGDGDGDGHHGGRVRKKGERAGGDGVDDDDDDDEPNVLEKSGSCMSLVVRCCRSSVTDAAAAATAAVSSTHRIQLATLALAPILIDTDNLQSSGRTTAVDRAAVDYLEAEIRDARDCTDYDNDNDRDERRCAYSRQAFYQLLRDAKVAIDHLAVDQILRKDYKEWVVVGGGGGGGGDGGVKRERGDVRLGISLVAGRSLSWLIRHAQDRGQGGDGDRTRNGDKDKDKDKDKDTGRARHEHSEPSQPPSPPPLASRSPSGPRPSPPLHSAFVATLHHHATSTHHLAVYAIMTVFSSSSAAAPSSSSSSSSSSSQHPPHTTTAETAPAPPPAPPAPPAPAAPAAATTAATSQREILLYIPDRSPRALHALRCIEDACVRDLRLERWGGSGSGRDDDGGGQQAGSDAGTGDCVDGGAGLVRVWRQAAVEKSRKEVAPLLRRALLAGAWSLDRDRDLEGTG